MGLYGPIATLWNGDADQLKFPDDQLKLHGCIHFTKETCVCGFRMSKKWSFGPIQNDARPIVDARRPHMPWTMGRFDVPYHCFIYPWRGAAFPVLPWIILNWFMFLRDFLWWRTHASSKIWNIFACNIVLYEKPPMSICAPWANTIFQFQITLNPDREQAPSRVEKTKGASQKWYCRKKTKSVTIYG